MRVFSIYLSVILMGVIMLISPFVIIYFFLKCAFYAAFPIGNFIVHSPLYAYTRNGDTTEKMIYVAILFFWFMAAAALFLLFVHKAYKRYKKKRRFENDHMILPELLSYLSGNNFINNQDFIDQFKMLYKRICRGLYMKMYFLESMKQIYVQTSDDVRSKILIVFNNLEMQLLVGSCLKSPNIAHKLFALDIIGCFRITSFEKKVYEFIWSDNQVLHSAAIVAYIKANPDNNLEFLTEYDLNLSDWDLNNIILSVQNHTAINYRNLIQSRNTRISELGIRLCYMHNQVEQKELIYSLDINKNIENKAEIYHTIATFASTKLDYKTLMFKFEIIPEQVQSEIIRLIGNTPDKQLAVKFLDWLVETKPSKVKVEALRQLLLIDVINFTKYRNHEDPHVANAYLQILDLNM